MAGTSSSIWARLKRAGGLYFSLLFARDTPWAVRGLLVISLIYLASPYDLLPDWLLGFGIVDDVAIVSALSWLALKLNERLRDQNQTGTGDT